MELRAGQMVKELQLAVSGLRMGLRKLQAARMGCVVLAVAAVAVEAAEAAEAAEVARMVTLSAKAARNRRRQMVGRSQKPVAVRKLQMGFQEQRVDQMEPVAAVAAAAGFGQRVR